MHALLAPSERFRAKVLHGAADILRGRCRRHGLAERDAHGVRNTPREFPEKTPAGKTEDRAPHAIQVHGDDRHIHALDDALHAAAKGQHLADARHLAFGEDANDFAVFQRVRSHAQGMNHFARPLVRRDGNHTHDFCKRFYERMLVGAFEHDEANRAIDRSNEQHRVGHGNVIRRKQRTAPRRHVFAPLDIQAIQRVRRDPEQQSKQGIGKQIDYINCSGK